jgi:hypothetical protein
MGVVVPKPAWLPESDTRGRRHIRAEDTFEADYGRLLERAAGTLSEWRARRDSNPLPLGSKPSALSK